VPRDSYVLATKVFFPMGDGSRKGGGGWVGNPNDSGLSRKHVWEGLHHSLRRLGTDCVDLCQCHRFDESVPVEETCRLHGWPEPASNQPQYSALWRRIERRVLPVSKELGLGQVVWAPLAMGVLTGKYTSVTDVLERMDAILKPVARTE
jgi:aryl-alcohol dehydrogenase-like predicted oxidoreductase